MKLQNGKRVNGRSATAETTLARVLRQIIDARGMRHKAVAERIGITESSLSNILHSRARPRQVTLTRFIKELSTSPAENQRIIAAYDNAEFAGLIENPVIPDRPVSADDLERTKRYMEIKYRSLAFEQEVAQTLRNSNIRFEQPFSVDTYICDFYLEDFRTAIDCKFNVNRDWDRARATVILLLENIPCDRVIIVVPEENEGMRLARMDIEKVGGKVAPLNQLVATITGSKH